MAFCKHDNDKDCSNQNAPSKTLPIWWLPLPGREAAPFGIGVFNLAAAGSVGCWSGGCLAAGDLGWQLSGTNIFGLGNTVPQTTAETSVYQRLSASTDVALTGALFPGVSGKTPTVVGSYAGITTKGSGTTGSTTDGADPQNAASWCYRDGSTPAGDTLVFGFSAHTNDAKKNELQTVLFDTRRTTSGIPLTRISKAPKVENTPAADTVYSELWYKHNPPYSYGTRILGTITSGAPVVGSFYAYFRQGEGICVRPENFIDLPATLKKGDTIYTSEKAYDTTANTKVTIDGIFAPGETGNLCDKDKKTGNTYDTFFATSPAPKSQASEKLFTGEVTYTERVLNVTKFIGGSDIAANDSVVGSGVTGGTYIVGFQTGTGQEGTYLLNAASANVSGEIAMVVGGATSTTVDGVTTVSVPKAPVPQTVTDGSILVAVRLGNSVRAPDGSTTSKGRFAANTVIQKISPDRKSFTISPAAEVDLVGAELCGGTCALFDHSSATTGFRLATSALPAGTDSWVAGFTCLDSVDGAARPTPLNSAPSVLQSWSEVAQ